MEELLRDLGASFQALLGDIIDRFPSVLAGIALFLVCWLVARALRALIARGLRAVRFDQAMERLQVKQFLSRINSNKNPSDIAARFVYWVIMLLIFVAFADAMQMHTVSEKISVLINYLPNVLLAVIILVVGLFLAGRLRDIIQASMEAYSIGASKLIGNIFFYLISIFVVLTTLEQLRFNIELLNSNVLILLGGVALAFAIGYGLAAKEIFPHIISSYYNKGTVKLGDIIRIGETEGEVSEITNIAIVIRTKQGKRYIPAKKFVSEEFEILQSTEQ